MCKIYLETCSSFHKKTDFWFCLPALNRNRSLLAKRLKENENKMKHWLKFSGIYHIYMTGTKSIWKLDKFWWLWQKFLNTFNLFQWVRFLHSSTSRSIERKTSLWARQAACMYPECEDSGWGQGFLFHSRPQWIHLLGRYLAKPSHWRTGPSFVSMCPQSHSNTNKLAHKVPLRARRQFWVRERRGEEYGPVFSSFSWCCCRPTLGALNGVLRTKISSRKKKSVL